MLSLHVMSVTVLSGRYFVSCDQENRLTLEQMVKRVTFWSRCNRSSLHNVDVTHLRFCRLGNNICSKVSLFLAVK